MAAFGIRTNQVTLARVAQQAAANKQASTFSQPTGIGELEEITNAEEARLSAAIAEVVSRLHSIVERNDPHGERHGRRSDG